MFDELWKEATEIPFMSRARFLADIQRPFGFPQEPVLTEDAACGLSKIASILKQSQSEGEATRELERQAMVDPQIQQALDYHQMKNERDSAIEQAQQMNQQLFEAQSSQAMADQQAQQMGQQVAELQGQVEQETMVRQQAQQEMVASKDQSLQEQMAVQNQKQQMNDAAQMFQEQANMLTQQLKGIAAQPTAPPPPMEGAPGQGGPGIAEQLPPPASADAAQEQQEAANAEQEASIQGQQAMQATEEDMAAQEQQAQMQGGAPPEGMPPEMAGEMPKQGSDISKLAAQIKQAYIMAVPIQHRPSHLDPNLAKSEGRRRGGLIGGAIGGAIGGMGMARHGAPAAVLGALGGATAGGLGLGALTGKLDERQAIRNRDRYQANLIARKQLRDEAKNMMGKQGSLNPQIQGAIIGAAVGALGGAGAGALPGMTTGAVDAPGGKAYGGMKGMAKGMLASAASGAAGGALVGHTLMGKGPKDVKKLVAGGGLLLGAPAIGALAGAGGKDKAASAMDRILEKTAEQISKCSGCGKMTKNSELGKCSTCGGKHKEAGKKGLVRKFVERVGGVKGAKKKSLDLRWDRDRMRDEAKYVRQSKDLERASRNRFRRTIETSKDPQQVEMYKEIERRYSNLDGSRKEQLKDLAKKYKSTKKDIEDKAYGSGKKRLAVGTALVGGTGLAVAGAKKLKSKKDSEEPSKELPKAASYSKVAESDQEAIAQATMEARRREGTGLGGLIGAGTGGMGSAVLFGPQPSKGKGWGPGRLGKATAIALPIAGAVGGGLLGRHIGGARGEQQAQDIRDVDEDIWAKGQALREAAEAYQNAGIDDSTVGRGMEDAEQNLMRAGADWEGVPEGRRGPVPVAGAMSDYDYVKSQLTGKR